MMSNKELVERLTALTHLDIDAILAHDQALSALEAGSLHRALEACKEDHVRHIEALSHLLFNHGGKPPAFAADLKGFLLEGMTAVMSQVGARTALLALVGSESLTVSGYKAHAAAALPADVRAIVERGHEDEKRHLATVKAALRERLPATLRAKAPADGEIQV